jgi:hypothetical protein
MNSELQSEDRKEALAAEADTRIKGGAHWNDWMYLADGFAVGVTKAMRAAGTNKPYGKAYTRLFGEWLEARPWAKRYDKGTRSNLLWCADHRSEIEEWRSGLAQNERDKLNHPTNLRRKYEAAHKKVESLDEPKKPRQRPWLKRMRSCGPGLRAWRPNATKSAPPTRPTRTLSKTRYPRCCGRMSKRSPPRSPVS